MRKTRTIIVSLALAALPAVAFAQGGPGGGPGRGARNPVATLLERRDTLRLTAEQVTRLEVWRQRWDTETAPMRSQLDSMRAQGGGAAPDQATMDRMQPVMQQMRTISAALRDSAYAVLTTEQQTLARALTPMGQGRRP